MGDSPKKQDVTVQALLHEVKNEYLQLEHGLLATFLMLLRRPSDVVFAYINRTSNAYTRPLAFLMASVGISLFINWLVFERLAIEYPLETGGGEADRFIRDYLMALTLLILPLIALCMRLFFWRLSLSYVAALVVLAYTQAIVNLINSLLLLPLILLYEPFVKLAPLMNLGLLCYVMWAWAGCARGHVLLRWGAAFMSVLAAQVLNVGLLWLVKQIV